MRLIRLATALCLLILSSSVSAAIFSTIDSVTTRPPDNGLSGTLFVYQFTIHSWDTEAASTKDLLNPCYGWPQCSVGINHRHSLSNQGGATNVANQCVINASQGTTSARTMGELGLIYKRYCPIPTSGSTSHRQLQGTPSFPECVSMFYSSAAGGPGNGQMLPGARCGIVPPPVGQCGVTEGNILLDHKTVSPQDIKDGTSQVTRTVNLQCSSPFNIQFFVQHSGGIVPLGNSGINSKLTVNGQSLDGYQVRVSSAVSVPITSTLQSSRLVTDGSYSGSTTVILTIP